MSLIGRAARLTYRNTGFYKLTPKRKAALQKAIKASAMKRKGKGKAGLTRKIVRYGERISGTSSTNFRATSRVQKMGLKKNWIGSAKMGNFKGSKGKSYTKTRLATYADRLNAGRESYRSKSLGGKIVRNLTGARYDTMTYGENFRRNIARSLKVQAVGTAAQAAMVGGMVATGALGSNSKNTAEVRQSSRFSQGISQAKNKVTQMIARYRNSHKPTTQSGGRGRGGYGVGVNRAQLTNQNVSNARVQQVTKYKKMQKKKKK